MDDSSGKVQDQINKAAKKADVKDSPDDSSKNSKVDTQSDAGLDKPASDEVLSKSDEMKPEPINPDLGGQKDKNTPDPMGDILSQVQKDDSDKDSDKKEDASGTDKDLLGNSTPAEDTGLVDQLIKNETFPSEPSPENINTDTQKPAEDIVPETKDTKKPRKKGTTIALLTVLLLLIMLPIAVFYIGNKDISLGDIRNWAGDPYPGDPICDKRPGGYVCRDENPGLFDDYPNPLINIVFCNEDGSIGAYNGYDVCGTPTYEGDSCDGMIRLSDGEAAYGGFVGCDGTSNCFCGGANDDTPVGGQYYGGQVYCQLDDNCDSCARWTDDVCVGGPDATPTDGPGGGSSPTPTTPPAIECNDLCTSNDQCPSSLICYEDEGLCRNPDCSERVNCICPAPSNTPTPTPTPVIECNDSCTTDSQCPDSLVCSGDLCRNPDCTEEADCSCPAPSDTPTPSPTPIVLQCEDIKIYKDGVLVSDPSTLLPGDIIEIAVTGQNATKGRVRVNGSAWTESNTTNTNGEFVVTFELPEGVSNYVIEAEIYRDNQWD
ncbi:hypothetical protein ACFL1A_03140 [Patescibacteria group bacterium]